MAIKKSKGTGQSGNIFVEIKSKRMPRKHDTTENVIGVSDACRVRSDDGNPAGKRLCFYHTWFERQKACVVLQQAWPGLKGLALVVFILVSAGLANIANVYSCGWTASVVQTLVAK